MLERKRATDRKNGFMKTNPSEVPPEITELTAATTELLEAAFAKISQPTSAELDELQEKTNIDERRLTSWFERKRRGINNIVLIEKKKFEEHHQNALIEAYQKNKYLTTKEMNELGDRIGMERARVRRWIKYRRAQDKHFDKDNPILPKPPVKIEDDKRCVLMEKYQENNYPTPEEMYALADRVGLKKLKFKGGLRTKGRKTRVIKAEPLCLL